MKNSRYFNEIEAAREFENDAKQMFNYATDSDIIDAACYFIKGAEIIQKKIASRAINEQRQKDTTTDIQPNKSLLKKLLGGASVDNKTKTK